MTHTELVKKHLLEYGNITSWEAIQQYGITRLSAVIFNLKKEGLDIEAERVPFVNRYGTKSSFAKYTLGKSEE